MEMYLVKNSCVLQRTTDVYKVPFPEMFRQAQHDIADHTCNGRRSLFRRRRCAFGRKHYEKDFIIASPTRRASTPLLTIPPA